MLNMQKDSWNIINLHQVLNIETLQIMELKKEKKFNNSIYNAPFVIFQKMLKKKKHCPFPLWLILLYLHPIHELWTYMKL
jgi:hypothetical protein